MLNRLLERFRGADAPTEDDSDRDGVFSYAGEYHAAVIGLGAGFAAAILARPEIAGAVIAVALGTPTANKVVGKLRGRGVVRELRREPWYGVGATLVGYGLGVATDVLAIVLAVL
ncbi:hypothetical protein BRC81_03035 [Halobacteriales archaeon QS_1_68_20]|nr:MAG: hypothetical protein BRC81_03035 [Halobacteriales archaeon QS_1_68_20]